MEAFFKDDDGRIIATYTSLGLYVVPGVDREMLAFALFKLLNEALGVGQQVSVTWGSRYNVRAG